MSSADLRPSPTRHAPAVLGCAAVLAAAGAGMGATLALSPLGEAGARAGAAFGRLADGAQARRPLALLAQVSVRVLPGETLIAAVQRTGVAEAEAQQAAAVLGRALDVAHIRAGLAFQAAVARPHGPAGPARLVALSLRTGPASALTLSRANDGALRLQAQAEPVRTEPYVAAGAMHGSLYESAIRAGATPTLAAAATKLFAKTLDFARDIRPGDRFRLVFGRKVTAAGRTVETGDLLYAEIAAKGGVRRFYRFDHDGKSEFRDAGGQEQTPLLLTTPLEGARITSSFGMRLHPILGFNRLHPGVDFGAPAGTPVFAAGDGVVEEARWAGGYGNWLKLKHAQAFETGYGHLLRFAPGVKPGAAVRQGEVVAYVGSTGLSTGAHLHYEVIEGGERIDPHSAKAAQAGLLTAEVAAAFRQQRARIDALLSPPPLRTASLR